VVAWRVAVVALLALIALGGAALVADVNKAERVVAPIVVAAIVLDRLCRRERTANWAMATTAALALVAIAAHDLLPGYARRFSLKRAAQVEPHVGTVYCYPQPFDSISFYRQDSLRAFAPERREHLIAELQSAEDSLLFVKSNHLTSLVANLPRPLEFVSIFDDAGVTVGRVVPRTSASTAGYARAD
jgi:hypothetical protein